MADDDPMPASGSSHQIVQKTQEMLRVAKTNALIAKYIQAEGMKNASEKMIELEQVVASSNVEAIQKQITAIQQASANYAPNVAHIANSLECIAVWQNVLEAERLQEVRQQLQFANVSRNISLLRGITDQTRTREHTQEEIDRVREENSAPLQISRSTDIDLAPAEDDYTEEELEASIASMRRL
jgi:hypothetical protein